MIEQERDPFARTTILRETVGEGTCTNCGTYRKRIYRYYVRPDSINGQKYVIRGTFCDRQCRDSYHG